MIRWLVKFKIHSFDTWKKCFSKVHCCFKLGFRSLERGSFCPFIAGDNLVYFLKLFTTVTFMKG